MAALPGERVRLSRTDRRRSIVETAIEVFVESGSFAATTIDALSERAGVTRAILYRHFDSKAELYTAALQHAGDGLRDATTDQQGQLHDRSVARIRVWAQHHRSAFTLLFRDAAREPDFFRDAAAIRAAMAEVLSSIVSGSTDPGPWVWWRSQLAVSTVVEAVLLWLDAGAPEPEEIDQRILQALSGLL